MSSSTTERGIHSHSHKHGLPQTRWCDPFELSSSSGKGCMLLDLPRSPCDVTKLRMRTMSQRLRKALECTKSGGKYGLLQAVMLSLDSQPATSDQWVREAIALEACSRVLLPAAHEVPLDLDAARAAFQRLDVREQQLWQQVQAARMQLSYSKTKPGTTEGYLLDEICTANVLGGITGDGRALASEVVRVLMFERRWDLVITLSKRYGLVGDPAARPSLQAAYSWELAAYHHHGEDHPETRAALLAAEKADPKGPGWVPKLLAGLTYPPLTLSPDPVPGSKEEAAEYAYHYGVLWLSSNADGVEHHSTPPVSAYAAFSAPLRWLLTAHGLNIFTPQQEGELATVRQLVCGDAAGAHRSVASACAEACTLLAGTTWPSCQEEFEQRGGARLLRALAVTATSLAAVTTKLPPLAAAPQLWAHVGESLGGKQLMEMAYELRQTAEVVVPWVSTLLRAYGEKGNVDEATAERLGCWACQEVKQLLKLAPHLSIAAARWMWQCGDAAAAKEACSMAPGRPLQILGMHPSHFMHVGISRDVARDLVACMGMLPERPLHTGALEEFVSQLAPVKGVGLKQLCTMCSTYATASAEEQLEVIAKEGNRGEQRLYGMFPGWLDQLLSQVTGRRVTLVVQLSSASAGLQSAQDATSSSSVFLKDAATGEQQPFYWRQPGDADSSAAHDLLTQQAVSRGCTDAILQRYCPAVEPYAGAPASFTAGSCDSSSSSSSSSSKAAARRRKQQQRQQQLTAAAAFSNDAAAAGTLSIPASALDVAPGGLCQDAAKPQATSQGLRSAAAADARPWTAGGSSTAVTAAAPAGADGAGDDKEQQSGEQGTGAEGTGPAAGSSSHSSTSNHSGSAKPHRPCAHCGELFLKLKQCSRCKAVAYCSRECQVAHWKAGHKESCPGHPAG